MRIKLSVAAAVSLAVGWPLVPAARAAVQEADAFSAGAALSNQGFFDGNITATDLVNQGTATFKQQVNGGTTSNGGSGGGTFDKLNDGTATSKDPANGVNNLNGDTYFASGDLAGSPTTTFFLNTAVNAAGYDLTTIKTINGWADTQTFSNQHYVVSVRTVNGTTFQPLKGVDYTPFATNSGTNPQNSSMVTLTDSTGVLASHVDAVRFTYGSQSVSSSGQVVREIEVAGQASSGPVPPAPPPVPAILPLGDSITYGDQANPGPIPGGYRTKLYTDLKNAGVTFNYVGSQTGNASATLTAAGQVNNEGHNGYRVDQITNNLDGSDGTGGNNGGFWLAGGGTTGRDPVTPNYVLLHIGTNDILQHYDTTGNSATEAVFLADLETRLRTLIDRLTTDRPSAHLLLSNIIPIPNHTNVNGVDENTEVQQYNAYIKDTLVPLFRSMGRDVTFVDQYHNFVDGNGNIITSLLPDNIHPNQAGYDLMGDTWAAAVQSVPEPSSAAALAGVAAAGLLRRRRIVRPAGSK